MKKLFVLFSLLLFSCTEDASVDSNINLNDEVWIKYNQSITFGTEPMSLKFNDLLSDSRCPSNVVCVWQGEATLSCKVFKPGTYESNVRIKIDGYVGKMNTDAHKFVDTLGYRFTLMHLDPYPHTDSIRQLSDYIALLKIRKLE